MPSPARRVSVATSSSISNSASRSNGRTASSPSARPQDHILADCHRTVSFYHMNVVPIGDFLPTVMHAYAKAAARRSSTFRNGQREFAEPLVGRIPPAVRRCAVVRAGAQERLSTIAQCEQQLADLPMPGNHAGALDRRLPRPLELHHSGKGSGLSLSRLSAQA